MVFGLTLSLKLLIVANVSGSETLERLVLHILRSLAQVDFNQDGLRINAFASVSNY